MNIIPLENVLFFLFSSAFLHHICMIFALDSVFINKKIRSIGSLSPTAFQYFSTLFQKSTNNSGILSKNIFWRQIWRFICWWRLWSIKATGSTTKQTSFPVAFFITWKIESPLLWSKWNNLFWNSSKIVTVNLFFLYRT